jgi:hypothetical protein
MEKTRRKQSATKRPVGIRARKLKHSPSNPSTESIVKAIRKDAELLLQGQSSSAVKRAKEIITKLVVKRADDVAGPGDKVLFLLSCLLSVKQFSGYATLDSNHINRINAFIRDVQRYIEDVSQKRPLNFLMLAAPGTGKSHFIECIARHLRSHKVESVTFNMAGLQRHEDLIPPLDSARNWKVQDRIPLLFLDEFDANEANTALLLPLLWDGELNLGQRGLKLGKVIIVLAGSHPNLQTTMNHARSMKLEVPVSDGRNPKLVDLLSRINGGVIDIPPFYDLSKELDRRFDKVCVAVELLRKRFPTLRQVPLALLQFLALTEFRYGSRSIAHFINMISYTESKKLTIRDIQLPISDANKLKEDSLAYHLLHDDQAHGVAETWKKVTADHSTFPVHAESLKYLQAEGVPASFLDFQLGFLVDELSKA